MGAVCDVPGQGGGVMVRMLVGGVCVAVAFTVLRYIGIMVFGYTPQGLDGWVVSVACGGGVVLIVVSLLLFMYSFGGAVMDSFK